MAVDRSARSGGSHLKSVRARSFELPQGTLPPTLLRDFEELGLNGSQARVLLALLRLGAASSTHLARLSEMPRTAVYPVLEELSAKRLVLRVAGEGPAVWATPGREEVLDRLHESHEENFRALQAKLERTRQTLAETFPETPSVPLPFVHVVHGAADVKRFYERLLSEAQSEVLVFNRPPYSWPPEDVNPIIPMTADRGVDTRVLYQAAQLEAPESAAFWRGMESYHRAGVKPRVVDELPIKLAVADRAKVLLAMTDPGRADGSFPTTLYVEHEGFARLQAAGFENLWASARPYPRATG